MYITTMVHSSDEFSESRIVTFKITEADLNALQLAAKFFNDTRTEKGKPFVKIVRYGTVQAIWSIKPDKDPDGELADKLYDEHLCTPNLLQPDFSMLEKEDDFRYDFSYIEIWMPYGNRKLPSISFEVFFKHDGTPWYSMCEVGLEEILAFEQN